MSDNVIKRHGADERRNAMIEKHKQTTELMDSVRQNGLLSVPGVKDKFASAVEKAKETGKKR